MAIKSKLTGLGCAAELASNIAGKVNTTLAGAGTSSTDATLLTRADMFIISTAANNSGVILAPGNGTASFEYSEGDEVIVANYDANTLLLYPPAGGKLNNGTATTGTVSIATHTSVLCKCIDRLNFVVMGPLT